jgi:predicted GIY-YIG superfamily endonuclease
VSHQYLSGEIPTLRSKPRRNEAQACFVYLIKRSDGVIKVGVSKNVRRRQSHLAIASPDKLLILKTIRPGRELALQIETGVKILLRPFRVRGEWYKCSDALALLALRAAEHGELECRACVAAEIKRQCIDAEIKRQKLNVEFKTWHGVGSDWHVHNTEMWKRFPDFMREVDPWGVETLRLINLVSERAA